MNMRIGKAPWLAVVLSAGALYACGGEDGNGGGTGDGGADASTDGGDGGDGGGTSGGDGGGDDGGGSNGGDGGTTGGSDGGTDGPSCGASPFEAAPVPANLLLVVDKSGSMATTPEGGGFSSAKWPALTDALDTAFGAAPESLSFGVDLYPADAFCGLAGTTDLTVDFGSGSSHASDMVTALEGVTPEGATPTAAALARALEYYTTGAGASLEGGKYVLLATDGGPNCNDSLTCGEAECTQNLEGANPACTTGTNCCDPNVGGNVLYCLDDDATVAAVQALADAGIQTAVVGILEGLPGSATFAATLDSAAAVGGLESGDADHDYYAVSGDGSGTGSLVDALTRITSQLITTCDLQLASDPPDINKLNVEVDGTPVPRDSDDGWVLDEGTSPPTVRLQGALCTMVESDGVSSIDVTFGCPTVIIL